MVRTMRAIAIAILFVACTEHGMSPPGDDDNPVGDASTTPMIGCSNGHADKIKFDQKTSCQNDGSVEFCIPDNDSNFEALLANISPTIHCAAGGGRANCTATPGLLLCTYPTAFPTECVSTHGEMTVEAWSDMCDLAGLAAVTEIVPTVFE
jgi:hypothetical protein